MPRSKSKKRGPPPAPSAERKHRKMLGVVRRGRIRRVKRAGSKVHQRTKAPKTRIRKVRGSVGPVTGLRRFKKKRRSLKK